MGFQSIAVAALSAILLPLALGAEASAKAAALAQSGTSTSAGALTDSTAGAPPGVVVRVVNEDTGVTVETFTNQEGLYRVTAQVPGTYRFETMLDGFDPGSAGRSHCRPARRSRSTLRSRCPVSVISND